MFSCLAGGMTLGSRFVAVEAPYSTELKAEQRISHASSTMKTPCIDINPATTKNVLESNQNEPALLLRVIVDILAPGQPLDEVVDLDFVYSMVLLPALPRMVRVLCIQNKQPQSSGYIVFVTTPRDWGRDLPALQNPGTTCPMFPAGR